MWGWMIAVWKTCQNCSGTGQKDGKICTACQGAGGIDTGTI